MLRTTCFKQPTFSLMPLMVCMAFVLATSLVSPPAGAAETQMSEREHLARILHELDALTPIIINAQRAPKNPGRTRFKYRAFARDIKLMRDGIESYIHNNLDQPRQAIAPLSGGYTE